VLTLPKRGVDERGRGRCLCALSSSEICLSSNALFPGAGNRTILSCMRRVSGLHARSDLAMAWHLKLDVHWPRPLPHPQSRCQFPRVAVFEKHRVSFRFDIGHGFLQAMFLHLAYPVISAQKEGQGARSWPWGDRGTRMCHAVPLLVISCTADHSASKLAQPLGNVPGPTCHEGVERLHAMRRVSESFKASRPPVRSI